MPSLQRQACKLSAWELVEPLLRESVQQRRGYDKDVSANFALAVDTFLDHNRVDEAQALVEEVEATGVPTTASYYTKVGAGGGRRLGGRVAAGLTEVLS
jgi:hypothetical protein